MILCFGIFAGILSYCRKILPEVKFVPRIAWVVDKMNSSLGSKIKSDVADGDLDGMEGNSSVVSRLLSCERGFELSNISLPSVEVAAERFKAKVLPFIDDDKIGKAVLAILYVISKDESIEGKRKESFRKHIGMHKDELLRQKKLMYLISLQGYCCIQPALIIRKGSNML